MHTTSAFKNGDLQAVEIPTELAFERTDIDFAAYPGVKFENWLHEAVAPSKLNPTMPYFDPLK